MGKKGCHGFWIEMHKADFSSPASHLKCLKICQLLLYFVPTSNHHTFYVLLAYRNWINSMGVNPPHVNRLYNDLQDGLILFKLYDIIQPGCVDWKRVCREFKKMKATFEKIGTLNFG